MSTIRIINVTFQIWGAVMSLGVLIGIRATRLRSSQTDDDYCLLLISNIIILLSDAAALFFRGRMGLIAYLSVRLLNFMFFLMQNIQALLFIRYQKHYIEQKNHQSISKRYEYCGLLTVAATFLLLVINAWHPVVYTFGGLNTYERLPYFPLISILVLICFSSALIMFIRCRAGLTKLEYFAFIFIYTIPALTGIINSFKVGLVISQMGTTLGIVVLFFIVQELRGRYVAEQEHEQLKQSTLLMLSQIQPHFLFNALNSIEYLCVADPSQAEQCVNHLAKYLRENMASISSTAPIPFSQEIEHVKNYLFIEQIRFPNIQVTYRLEEMNFSLPSLTIQPIVENAVKHGLRGKRNGSIRIESRKNGKFYEVEVIDNGCGFDPASVDTDNLSHNGLRNVQLRLELVSRGKMKISSGPEGTAVLIRVPRQALQSQA